MRLGFFGARSDDSGLGNQWVALARLLKPAHTVLIDSTGFNGNQQHPERYDRHKHVVVRGFPTDRDADEFLDHVDTVFMIETPYNWHVVDRAKQLGKRTILMLNYEFLDPLANPTLPVPDVLLAPADWHLDELRSRFGDRVQLLPPPTFPADFVDVRATNLARTGRKRFLHVVGKQAVHDRNGTHALAESLRWSTADYELVIKSQHPLNIRTMDRRVTIDPTPVANYVDLYRDYDALILPRQYGGLCLPMNEGLMAGLPLVMTDVEPNNKVLPGEWLVPAMPVAQFMARTLLPVCGARRPALGAKLDDLTGMDLSYWKQTAFGIAYERFAPAVLRACYRAILG